MTGFFREWFINHFANADNIEARELRGKLWKAIASTDIVIESITQWRPDLTQKRLKELLLATGFTETYLSQVTESILYW
jgi:hypothetical protein